MNQIEANRTSYDALREAIMDLSEDECMEVLRMLNEENTKELRQQLRPVS